MQSGQRSLPHDLTAGDILCSPVTGAYGYSMASSYNRLGRPAVVFAANGHATTVLRRETPADMMHLDAWPASEPPLIGPSHVTEEP